MYYKAIEALRPAYDEVTFRLESLDYVYQTSTPIGKVGIVCLLFLLAILGTFFAVWLMPYLTRMAVPLAGLCMGALLGRYLLSLTKNETSPTSNPE